MEPPGTVRTVLTDGTSVTVRAVTPDDADALIAGFERLSRQSRLFRFLNATTRLSPKDVDTFTSPDHALHIALGAILHEDGKSVPAGIAHLFRAPATMDRAELALTVIDPYQRRGLGTLLIGRLLAEATRLGIARLDAVVHPANHGMAHLLTALGAETRGEFGDRHFDLPVHSDPAAYGTTQTARAVAAAMRL